MPNDYDAKKYICAPWHGQRGPPWTRKFKPEFENALKMQKDNFNNIHQWLLGKDFGGWAAGAPAHIAGAGALAATFTKPGSTGLRGTPSSFYCETDEYATAAATICSTHAAQPRESKRV